MRCPPCASVERARRRDARDAIAAHADVAVEPWIAGAVDDLAVRDHDIVGARGRGQCAGMRTAGACGENEGGKRDRGGRAMRHDRGVEGLDEKNARAMAFASLPALPWWPKLRILLGRS